MLSEPSRPVTDELLTDLILSRIDTLIAALDRRIGAQLDEILHHPLFQRLERAWRGLWLVIERTRFEENIRIELLDCSIEDLRADFERAGRVQRSGLHAIVYDRAVGAGHDPYAAIIAAYEIGPEDASLWRSCGDVALRALAPFIAASSPRLFGVESHRELAGLTDLGAAFEWAAGEAWHRLRETDEARALGLTLPRFLLRAPFEPGDPASTSLAYTERLAHPEHACWGNASFAFATRLTESFARDRWCPNIIRLEGGGMVEGLPQVTGPDAEPTEVGVTAETERVLSELGLIPLAASGPGRACFHSASSLQRPRYFGETEQERAAEQEFRLSAQLPHLFIMARMGHYLIILYRSYKRDFETRNDIERELNDWVGQYVADGDVVSSKVRVRRPVRMVSVVITDEEGADDWRRMKIRLRPHFRHNGAFFRLSVTTVLETR